MISLFLTQIEFFLYFQQHKESIVAYIVVVKYLAES